MEKTTRTDTEKQAEEILRRPYSRILVAEDEGGFSASILEFPGCFAEGETADNAHRNLEAAAVSWILEVWESGGLVPEPLPSDASGKFLLRLPRSLHVRATKLAALEGVSLNQLIVGALAEKLGAATALSRIERAFSNPPAVKMRAFLELKTTRENSFIPFPAGEFEEEAVTARGDDTNKQTMEFFNA